MKNKNYLIITKGLKQLGVFFLALIICSIILIPFPQRNVKINYDQYEEIKSKEEKLTADFDKLSKNFKTKGQELSEKKQELITNRDSLQNEIENADKRIKELSEEVK